MAADEAIAQRAKRTGLGLIDPVAGLSGLYAIMSSLADPYAATALVAAVPVDWQVLLRASKGSVPNFFADMEVPAQQQLEAPAAAAAAPAFGGSRKSGATAAARSRKAHRSARGAARAAGRRQAAADEQQQQPQVAAVSGEAVQAAVLDVTRSILGAEVAPGQPLMDAGLDSLGESAVAAAAAAAFRCGLRPAAGLALPLPA